MENQVKPTITINGILEDLANGLTRTKLAKSYNAELGCIQDKYNLSDYDLKVLFKNSKLKNKKTHVAHSKEVSFILVDDTEPVVTTNVVAEVVVEKTPKEVSADQGWL